VRVPSGAVRVDLKTNCPTTASWNDSLRLAMAVRIDDGRGVIPHVLATSFEVNNPRSRNTAINA
jgi:hypothetical protein